MINANISITDYFSLIESYPGLGNAYLSNLKNTLMNMGYTAAGWTYLADEHHIYGSSRVGVHNTHFVLAKRFSTAEMEYTQKSGNQVNFIRGKRNYELSNHLGNVQVVITDKRISVCDNELQTERFEADILMATDYYPFGMAIPERQWYTGSDSSNYRYGFNGMEKDNEAKGPGNSLDFGARIYDSRLGRWLSVDPLFLNYPSFSPFNFAVNNPIFYVDGDGRVVIKSPEFKKKYEPAFKIFSTTTLAQGLLRHYATPNGDYIAESNGILGRHTLSFGTDQNNSYGLTLLKIKIDGEWVEYKPKIHGKKITKDTEFNLNINISTGKKEPVGGDVVILNHEAFLWGEDYTNALIKFENGEYSNEQLAAELQRLSTAQYVKTKYKDIYDNNSSLQKAHAEVIKRLKSELIVDPKTEEDKNHNDNINNMISDIEDGMENEKDAHEE